MLLAAFHLNEQVFKAVVLLCTVLFKARGQDLLLLMSVIINPTNYLHDIK